MKDVLYHGVLQLETTDKITYGYLLHGDFFFLNLMH